MENGKEQLKLSGRSKGGLFGFLLVLVGTLLLAFNFGWIDPTLRYVIFSWPALFLLFTIVALFRREFLTMFFWLALAAFFLLPRIAQLYPDALPGVDESFAETYWPILLILFGVGVILKIVFGTKSCRHRHLHRPYENVKVDGGNGVYIREVLFSGIEDIFLEPLFRGGQIQVVFGGVELDLRRTTLPEGDTILHVEAVFGGIKLYLPDDWVVIPKVRTVMGGVENKHFSRSTGEGASRRLIITGEMVFGGCEIG